MVDLSGLDVEHLPYLIVAEMQVSATLCLCTCLVVGNSKWDLPVATLMIGVVVTAGVMAGHLAGGGAMNPCRVLGPAFVSGKRDFYA